jgi:tryptophanyl-tRNA synthetase
VPSTPNQPAEGVRSETSSTGKRKRVLSGMRPTGPLHIGHYFGALQNWLKMQEEYDCFFFVADWHALTTHYVDTSMVAENTREVAIDWLSVGLDPAKTTIFIQSQVPDHAELHLLLSMVTPLSWLERVPTYKEQIENLKDRDLGTYGFLGYPLLQSADIVIYDADLVPVGEDQVPHVELTREIVRRFNSFYGFLVKNELFQATHFPALKVILEQVSPLTLIPAQDDRPADVRAKQRTDIRRFVAEAGVQNFFAKFRSQKKYFIAKSPLREPRALLTETPRLPGTDGRRMAKSYGNAIWLSDAPEAVRAKVRNMMTDPQRVRRTDPGRPEVCPVFAYHKLFSDATTVAEIDRDCRTAAIGCVDCKAKMADALVRWIEPIQQRRRDLEAHPQRVWDILDAGSAKARKAARRTMKRVREAIFSWERARGGAAGPTRATKKATTGN